MNQFIRFLSKVNAVDKVYLTGSRSPLREKQPHRFSDWDVVLFINVDKLTIPDPKIMFKLNVDVAHANKAIQDKWLDLNPKVVEIWPNDPYEVLK